MNRTIPLEVIGYHIQLSDELLGNGVFIEVEAIIGDSNGNELGRVNTDVYDFARNLPLALVKTYFLSRKIDNGTIVPEVNL